VTGKITFAPELGFTGNPTPVRYQVTDVSGNVTTAKVSIEYAAAQMASTGVQPAPILSLGTLVLLLGGAVRWFSRRRKSAAELG
jgi:LPXTG-motif cell wall-anchored protein